MKVMTGLGSPHAAARFAREAEIAARLHDPHLVSVLDVGGLETGRLYLVMELAVGRSLEDARASFGDVAWALELLPQIASGLSTLHAAGVVHRDLKPANVLLTADGDGKEQAKISDFGISQWTEEPDAPLAPTSPVAQTLAAASRAEEAATLPAVSGAASGALTATGAIMGTPLYMAPELVFGSKGTRPAADMFAFGILAYEMLSGRAPFSTLPLHAALAGLPLPAVDPLPSAVPAAVAEILLACLSVDPEGRPSADAVCRAFPRG